MVTVFIPDPERLERKGYGDVKHVPALFDTTFRYCQQHNLYLRERAKLVWHPSDHQGDGLGARSRPSQQTILKIAYSLSNFIDWCEIRQRDWKSLSYDDVLAYQQEQVDGRWSSNGRPLRPATANFRADEATNFLTWASDHGLRDPFALRRISTQTKILAGISSRTTVRQASVRPGRAKVSMSDDVGVEADLPTPEEVRDWLLLVRERRGQAKTLAARFILETGVRRDELVHLTVGQLPDAERLADLGRRGKAFAAIKLTKTKGGRGRTIDVPLAFAMELRRWADTDRLRMLVLHRRRVGSYPKEPKHLFLSDSKGHEGTPLKAHTIYRVFADVRPGPSKWHPHFARHAFACFWILHALEDEARAHGRTLKQLGPDWIAMQSQHWLSMLRRQLGHVDESTTYLYLRWIQTAAGVARHALGWHRYLSEPINSTDAMR
ncbi:site-specific integrase [Methylobacterium sp. J-030]|uniref:tyrosine-type recombinase/integrase n=1 Tax=Methylobacterium sp. J-030 TaxID=2836627 RepID=UPI001FBAD624|nr:site-specific integrase [Methylobacterium sp. J-030]MCJ2071075.1 site-specific integrase [Methylobacterium sp. J-030]